MASEKIVLEGRHAVLEALRAGHPVHEVFLLKGTEKKTAEEFESLCAGAGIPLYYSDKAAMDRRSVSGRHQGVIATADAWEYAELEDILANAANRGEQPFLILLDGIMDTHNLGAVIRTANMAGAHGVVITKDRAVGLTAAAAKASAGAVYYTPVARVTNMARTVEQLKKAGIWTIAADMQGGSVFEADLSGPVALVIGNEGKGVARLVKEKCDFAVSIPTSGDIDSLNASVACGILAFEVVRARLKKH